MKKVSIMRHTLEIRLHNRQFSFLDDIGKVTDRVVRDLGLQKISMKGGSRVDIANNDFSVVFFFTLENLGIQIEAESDFTKFRDNVNNLKSLVADKKLFNIDSTARIGTKSSILTHVKGKSLQSNIDMFLNGPGKGLKDMNSSVGLKSEDYGYLSTNNDFEDFKVNMILGPASLKEALEKFFNNRPVLYKDFGKDGVYCEIDLFKTEINKEPKPDEIFEQVEAQIEKIEKLHEKIIQFYFNDKRK